VSPAKAPITVSFPGGQRVDAAVAGYVVRTDQPAAHGGGGSAPDPFSLFLASLATCAGFYVQAFCSTRSLSTQGMTLTQEVVYDESKRLTEIIISIQLPPGFPERYVDAIQAAALSCKVKKALLAPPKVTVRVRPAAAVVAKAELNGSAALRGEEV
jgi:putative redox protein